MSKLKNPLLSFEANGRLSKALAFCKRKGQDLAMVRGTHKDVKTLQQLSWRHMWQKATALWWLLSAEERLEWESQGTIRHMTGYAWFMSQALKPNPGLYLPLQGGTMQGIIDMGGNRIYCLPMPELTHEPIPYGFYAMNIAPYLYKQGCRITFDGTQDIPKLEFTALDFDTQRYDTDNMHSLVLNTTRITCNYPGKYIITGHVAWEGNVAGKRQLFIRLNGTTPIAYEQQLPCPGGTCFQSISTVWNLSFGDFVELVVYHTSGVALFIDSLASYSPEFAAQRIGS